MCRCPESEGPVSAREAVALLCGRFPRSLSGFLLRPIAIFDKAH